ncbi:hypothetical protein HPB49_012128 [Dermacentor silvarum]|uniref:Uncharacterized protein n=1 Tax=Dermacentor silvarum TaxID=543639 RepID=A0ACB8DD58_DERSI|nr:uncharacterized protein LOC125943489 [Dermacentor silvarum]KAH7965913.1 hypothetical protein HPB49_012128 [Dermacentor silvarum]
MAAAEDDQELSIVRVEEGSGEYSSGTEPLEPPSEETTPPSAVEDDAPESDGVAYPYGAYQVREKEARFVHSVELPQSHGVLPVLPPDAEWESNQRSSEAFRTTSRDGAASHRRLKARVLVVSAAVTCSLAVAAYLIYRQLVETPRRFAEMRADQTDSIIADYTEPALPTFGDERDSVEAAAGEGGPGPLLNVTFDDLHRLGAWRRASGRGSRAR